MAHAQFLLFCSQNEINNFRTTASATCFNDEKKKKKKIEEKIRMYLHMHQAVKLNLENYVYILTCHDRLITKNLSP